MSGRAQTSGVLNRDSNNRGTVYRVQDGFFARAGICVMPNTPVPKYP